MKRHSWSRGNGWMVCVDCGNWNPEAEEEVIEARRVLGGPLLGHYE